MEIPRIYEYSDELNVNECRICLEEGEEELIAPCNCCGSHKYVHLKCLNRWRQENINNEKYHSCEVCKREFVIENNYKVEKLICIMGGNIIFKFPVYLFVVYFLGGILWYIDILCNYQSFNIISLGHPDKQFELAIKDVDNIQFNGLSPFYYTAFGVFLISIIHLLIHCIIIISNVHRKKIYFKNFFLFMIIYLLGSLNIYISYLSFIIFRSRIPFIIILCVSSFNNYLNIFRLIRKHNKIIKIMNDEIKNQVVYSIEDIDRNNRILNETIVDIEEDSQEEVNLITG